MSIIVFELLVDVYSRLLEFSFSLSVKYSKDGYFREFPIMSSIIRHMGAFLSCWYDCLY